jgi:hypothetical protein
LSSGERSSYAEKPKRMRRMDTTADCEAPGAIYRVKEGGETVSWRRDGQRRVKFLNAYVLGRRDEEATPILERGRSTWVDS